MKTPEEYDPATEQARLVIGDIFELCEQMHKAVAPNFRLELYPNNRLESYLEGTPDNSAGSEVLLTYIQEKNRSTQLIVKETNDFMHQALQLISQPHEGMGTIIAHPSLRQRLEGDRAFDTLNFRMHDEESFTLWHWQTSLAPSIDENNLDTNLLDIERVVLRTENPTSEHIWDISLVNDEPFISYKYTDIKNDHKNSSFGYATGPDCIAELHEAKTVLNYLVEPAKYNKTEAI